MKTIDLMDKIVFLDLNLSRMGDKRGLHSDEFEIDADKSRIQARKIIFKSSAFDRIKSLDSKIRRYARAQSFPYESGFHLIPSLAVDQITQDLKSYQSQRETFVQVFADVFPSIMEKQPEKLRSVFNRRDYDLDNIHDQFSMSWNFLQLSPPTNLEELNSELFKQERNKMSARMEQAFEEARLLLRETCLNLVTHLRISLESDMHGAAKRLSPSTVTNLQAFLNNFSIRDITDDRELRELIIEARMLTSGVSAESLRTMDGLRMRVRAELGVIEEAITKTLEVMPTRRIRSAK